MLALRCLRRSRHFGACSFAALLYFLCRRILPFTVAHGIQTSRDGGPACSSRPADAAAIPRCQRTRIWQRQPYSLPPAGRCRPPRRHLHAGALLRVADPHIPFLLSPRRSFVLCRQGV